MSDKAEVVKWFAGQEIEVLDDQNALIPGPSVALRWQEVKGLRAARTAAVAKALEERRDARRSLVEERKGRALERVDGAGWAQTTDLFGHKGDKRAQDQALLELVSANSLVTSSTQKLGTRYARPAYAERYSLETWVDRKDAKGIHGNYRGVHWDRGAQQWRAQDLQGISVGFFDDLEAAAKARDDAVFDPRNPAYAYRGRAQPNIPRANSQPVPTLARRTAPVSSSLAPPPHGHVFPANGHVFTVGPGFGRSNGNGFSLPPPESLDAPYRSNGRAPAVSSATSIGPGFGRSDSNGFELPPPPQNGE